MLTQTRWLLLRRRETLAEHQVPCLVELLGHNLRAVQAYLSREEVQFFWHNRAALWVWRFLDRWCTQTMRPNFRR